MSTNINTVLITGASSGIGLDLAKAFLKIGSNVVLNARNSEKLSVEAEKLGNSSKIACTVRPMLTSLLEFIH